MKASGRWKYSEWVEAGKTSSKFDSFKVYIIRCYDENESFIKVGKTFQTTEDRFKLDGAMPYNYEVLYEIISNGYNICKLEEKIKKELKQYSYKPRIMFNGYYECFEEEGLYKLKENGTL